MNKKEQNIELLNKLGYEYDESKDKFYSPENDSYLTLTLKDCNDIYQVVVGIICYEKAIAYHTGEEHAKRVMRSALGL